MILTDALTWISAFILLGYSVPACYYDLKYREMPVGFWTGLIVVCGTITIALYLTGTYQWYLGLLSLGMVMFYYMLYCVGMFEGADFVYLAVISLFLVKNPITGNVLMPVSFGIFLVASLVGTAIAYQILKYANVPRIKEMPNVPFMVPISLALWLTVGLA
jgi:hypothetical protein